MRALIPALCAVALTSHGCRKATTAEAGPLDPGVEGARSTPATGPWDPSGGFRRPINATFAGVTCFRGNPQRNYYGEGPIPTGELAVKWRSVVGALPNGHWAGVGWTGQPLIVEWPDDVRPYMNFLHQPGPKAEIIVGALDGQVHFYDAETGELSRNPLQVPSPRYAIKGTVSVDPRGYPLLYVGCGIPVGKPGYRVFSLLDFKELLWLPASDAKAPRHWAGSDSNALVMNDTLFEPAENGLFYRVKLNTSWDAASGKLSIDPEIEKVPIDKCGMENSMAVWEKNGFFADNEGSVWRINLAKPTEFRKIADLGDDTDSTISFDDDGTFYVGREVDKLAGHGGAGKIYRMDRNGKALWTWTFQAGAWKRGAGENPIDGGVLSSAAIAPDEDLVFYTTSHHPSVGRGYLVALERKTGRLRWKTRLQGFSWTSPIYADGVVFCSDSTGSAFVRNAATGETLLKDASGAPVEFFPLGANVESTPIVWRGRVYVGLRGGSVVCIEAAQPR